MADDLTTDTDMGGCSATDADTVERDPSSWSSPGHLISTLSLVKRGIASGLVRQHDHESLDALVAVDSEFIPRRLDDTLETPGTLRINHVRDLFTEAKGVSLILDKLGSTMSNEELEVLEANSLGITHRSVVLGDNPTAGMDALSQLSVTVREQIGAQLLSGITDLYVTSISATSWPAVETILEEARGVTNLRLRVSEPALDSSDADLVQFGAQLLELRQAIIGMPSLKQATLECSAATIPFLKRSHVKLLRDRRFSVPEAFLPSSAADQLHGGVLKNWFFAPGSKSPLSILCILQSLSLTGFKCSIDPWGHLAFKRRPW